MGLFGRKKRPAMAPVPDSRHQGKPMAILFENFVLSTIGKLPEEKENALNAMNLAGVLNTPVMHWKLVIKHTLQLSDTLEIAILDLWYKNQELACKQGIAYHPNQFAIDFTKKFFSADSSIDVWDADSLSRAKEHVSQKQAGEF
jgi:hypothetical protein